MCLLLNGKLRECVQLSSRTFGLYTVVWCSEWSTLSIQKAHTCLNLGGRGIGVQQYMALSSPYHLLVTSYSPSGSLLNTILTTPSFQWYLLSHMSSSET